MPNENIQPPSFDEQLNISNNSFDNLPVDIKEESASTDIYKYAYKVPLSIVMDTNGLWFSVFLISLVISAVMFTIILYSLIRVIQIRIAEKEKFLNELPSPYIAKIFGYKQFATNSSDSVFIKRWENVKQHLNSENVSDWRFAILEADILLNDLITQKGYMGDTMADKLKAIDISDLNSINDAWEAHKARNKIAHEGTSYELTYRETRRIINLYKNVFTELGLQV